ncbi:MAG TPA: PadR family transcriptional regulator [Candidatus Dormibacteraeota bacterium]|nr:PadR family transcriptional regulator [Candidatus Dormibacteraeota bacterium]
MSELEAFLGRSAETISPLALSILELLNERPMHPYELAATMRSRHYDEFVRLNFGSLYHTVDVLERDGWIVPAEREKEGKRPERTIYRLTDSGRSVLLKAVGEIIAQPRREYQHFSAGLMFMHHLHAEAAVELLEQRAQTLHAIVTKLSQLLDELLATHERLALIELEHKIALIAAERDWVRQVAKEITDGKLEWKAGIEAGEEKLRSRHGSSAH